jgi:hypothetical protein
MDLTWYAIFKVCFAGLVTYTILPAFLILRDFLLGKLIKTYILNEDLRSKLKQFVFLVNEWNTKYCKEASRSNKDGNNVFVIGGQPATQKEFNKYSSDSIEISLKINELDFFIKRRSKFLDWMLHHYKQQGLNPIQAWKDKELERLTGVK